MVTTASRTFTMDLYTLKCVLQLVLLVCPAVVKGQDREVDTVEEYDIRLAGEGASSGSGRVEVRQGTGRWAMVCNTGWSPGAAMVVCRQLNSTWGKPETKQYGNPPRLISVDRVRCAGSEARLDQCKQGAWGTHNCTHQEAAAVKCFNTTVRLLKSDEADTYGYLELIKDGQFNPICKSGWDSKDARVACREMGYVDGVTVHDIFFQINDTKKGDSQKYVGSVSCVGNETSLAACPFTNELSCAARNRATAICYAKKGDKKKGLKSELARGAKNWGYVTVHMAGPITMTICYKNFDDNAVTVMCRGVGYSHGTLMRQRPGPAVHSMPIYMKRPSCNGTESNIMKCPGWSSPDASMTSDANMTSEAAVTCQHTDDTIVLCYNRSFSIRLGDGGSSKRPRLHHGRVEIGYDGKWGTVCDRNWNDNAAMVACRMLGYEGGTASTKDYGKGSGAIYLDDVRCKGDEKNLTFCVNAGWQIYNKTYCGGHLHDAAVRCYSKVRLKPLQKGSTNFGMVMVKVGQEWGTVCGSTWNLTDVRIFCKEIGYENGVVPVRYSGPFSDSVSLIKGLKCLGNESSILDCSNKDSYCPRQHTSYATAYCFDGHISSKSLLSLDSQQVSAVYENMTGAVLLTVDGIASRLCADDWDDADANVTCKQLGHAGGISFSYKNALLNKPVVVYGFDCAGNETAIEQCTHAPYLGFNCPSTGGVLCYNHTAPTLRLVTTTGELTDNFGLIQITYDGRPGYVCDNQWSDRDAKVVCTQLNYVDGSSRYQGRGTVALPGRGYLHSVGCTGAEESIYKCSGTGWDSSPARPCGPVGVSCYKRARLDRIQYDSATETEVGRVQVHVNGLWGGACAHLFGDKEALVACRQAGYTNGNIVNPLHFITKRYPSGYRTWLTQVKCTGNETDLFNCSHVQDNKATCTGGGYSYAVVVCSRSNISHAITSSFDQESNVPTGGVRVSKYGIEGKVCASHWDDHAANVTCKENGYVGGVALAYRVNSRRTTWMLEYNCTGKESSLSQCLKNTTSPKPCKTTMDVGVLCYSSLGIEFRIRGSTKSKGWLEISYEGEWGGICDYGWSTSDARVFCKQMGYIDGSTKTAASVTSEYHPEPSSQWISRLGCRGAERTMLMCPSGGWQKEVQTSNCGEGNSAGVECFDDVRIRGTGLTGAVEANYNGRWGYVCDIDWDDKDANVMCRQLGHESGRAYPCSLLGKRSYYYYYVWSAVKCVGTEEKLADCPHEERGYLSCPSGEYASVTCFDKEPSQESAMDLVGTSKETVGIVRIKYADTWGRVCPNTWTTSEASVTCRNMGIGAHGIPYRTNAKSGSALPFWLSNVKCVGNETDLLMCNRSKFGEVCDCDTTMSAAVFCHSGTGLELRLADGGANYGRVEVAIDGRWGTLCDYGFSDNSASAVCRMLNYTSGSAKSRAHYGKGTGPIWATNINCKGKEKTFLECSLTGWDIAQLTSTEGSWRWSCPTDHKRDAGVYCYGSVRLTAGQTPDYGRMEMYKDDVWYQVCDDGTFDDTAATIVCTQLGYVSGKSICCSALGPTKTNNVFETRTLMNFKCNGTETDIRDCVYQKRDCTAREYVTVSCVNQTFNESTVPKIKLVNAQNIAYTGRVELDINGIKGRICAKMWDDKDATVVCRQLNYKGGVAYRLKTRGKRPYIMGNVNCTGNETSLSQCPHTQIGKKTGCQFSENSAGVLCYNVTGLQYRFGNGGKHYGQVEIGRDGGWGTICSYQWGKPESRILCKSMGFVDGVRYRPSSYVALDKDMLVSFIDCKGPETSVLQCPNNGWGNVPSYCRRYYSPVYVYCFGKVRLNSRGSYPNSAGAVEIYNANKMEWRTVCDTAWDTNDAKVICRQMGFQNGIASCCNSYGPTKLKPLLTNITCNGSEASLDRCSSDLFEGESCSYASAVCLNMTTIPTEYSLEIKSSGEASYTGYVKVTYAGIKGRICSDGWDNKGAKVACKEMGYPSGEAYTHYAGTSSSRAGPWLNSNFKCRGNETKLEQCVNDGWGQAKSCSRRNAAGVLCFSTDGTYFRLADGSETSGRIEVSFEGKWGTICDSYWDTRDAKAACRQFGFMDGESRPDSAFGKGTGQAWMPRYMCNGTEQSLYECPHQGWRPITYSFCSSHNNDAGVQCFKAVRISETKSFDPKNGPVLYSLNNTWVAVCSDGFTDVTARAVCRLLGYGDGRALCCSAYRTIRYKLANITLTCKGDETDISACQKVEECESGEYASVACFGQKEAINDTAYSFSLDGPHKDNGRVAVTLWDRDVRICGDNWGDTEARVVCRMQGFSAGIAYFHYGVEAAKRDKWYSRPIVLGGFNCTGSEASLLDCPHNNRTNLGNCSFMHDVGVLCYNASLGGVEYRLADGPTSNQGRVEMALEGVWGTVCDAAWDNKDAKVLCRSLNWKDGMAMKDAQYGEGNGTIWLSHVHCTGEEQSLLQCPHMGWNTSFSQNSNWWKQGTRPSQFGFCRSHSDDASVYCFGSVTFGKTPNDTYGAVRVFHNDTWQHVCDDGWSTAEARVVCREQGYEDGRAIPRSAFNKPTYNITMTGVHCTGKEASLINCTYDDWEKNTTCESGQYASVACTNETIVDGGFALRLHADEFSSDYHGLLEVRMDGVWGRICRNKWTDVEATVACRMLGYNKGFPYQHLIPNLSPILMSNVSCSGDEDSIDKCNYTRWGDQYACINIGLEAGVICENDTQEEYYMRLAGGNENSTGRIEIRYNGTWGTVCDNGWGIPDARVACKQLGFKDGLALSNSYYGNGAGPIWVEMFICSGKEEYLLACHCTGWNRTYNSRFRYHCKNHNHDASVKCYHGEMVIQTVRLAGSEIPGRGRVEVLISETNEWGTVCDDGFGDTDALVICRMHGYTAGEAFSYAHFGQGRGNIWIDELNCTGNESNIQECTHQGLGVHDCSHYEDAGVVCSAPLTTSTVSTPAASSSVVTVLPPGGRPTTSRPPTRTTTLTTKATTASTTTKTTPASTTTKRPTTTTTMSTSSSTSTRPPKPTTRPSSSTRASTITSTTPSTTSTTTTKKPKTKPTPSPTSTSSSTTATSAKTTTTTTKPTTKSTTPTPTTSSSTTTPTTTVITTMPPSESPSAATVTQPIPDQRKSSGVPIVAVIVPLLAICLVAAVVIGVGIFLYRRQRPLSAFRRQRLEETPAEMDNMPHALDAAKSNSHQFANKLYDLSEVELDLAVPQKNGTLATEKKHSDSAGLVLNDYLEDENDLLDNINPMYGTGTTGGKSSRA